MLGFPLVSCIRQLRCVSSSLYSSTASILVPPPALGQVLPFFHLLSEGADDHTERGYMEKQLEKG